MESDAGRSPEGWSRGGTLQCRRGEDGDLYHNLHAAAENQGGGECGCVWVREEYAEKTMLHGTNRGKSIIMVGVNYIIIQ